MRVSHDFAGENANWRDSLGECESPCSTRVFGGVRLPELPQFVVNGQRRRKPIGGRGLGGQGAIARPEVVAEQGLARFPETTLPKCGQAGEGASLRRDALLS